MVIISKKIAISVIALALIAAHIFTENIELDYIVLILFGVAMFPWLNGIVRAIGVAGMHAEYPKGASNFNYRENDVSEEVIRDTYNSQKQ